MDFDLDRQRHRGTAGTRTALEGWEVPIYRYTQLRLTANSVAKFNAKIPLNSTTAVALERYAKTPTAPTPTRDK